ncbi:MAG: hypothetical protein ABII00_14165 [Elusimicrobiota bacterium]
MASAQAAQERNPFSDAASQVLRAALSDPLKAWGVRELARLAGVSPALVVLVLNRLERLGHVSRERDAQARVLDPGRLVRDWAAWYAVKPLKDYRYALQERGDSAMVMDLLRKHRGSLPGRWGLTSMAGASLASPHSNFREVHVHLPQAERVQQSWRDVLGLVPDKLGPVHLILPYYSRSAADGIRDVDELPVVSDLQLFLDCYRYPVRGREQAEHILKSLLARGWKNAGQS